MLILDIGILPKHTFKSNVRVGRGFWSHFWDLKFPAIKARLKWGEAYPCEILLGKKTGRMERVCFFPQAWCKLQRKQAEKKRDFFKGAWKGSYWIQWDYSSITGCWIMTQVSIPVFAFAHYYMELRETAENPMKSSWGGTNHECDFRYYLKMGFTKFDHPLSSLSTIVKILASGQIKTLRLLLH